jgi:hypothetical protein
VKETKYSSRLGTLEDIYKRSDDEMKGIQNRQKPVVEPKDRKPKESVNFRKVNLAVARKRRAKVKKAQ